MPPIVGFFPTTHYNYFYLVAIEQLAIICLRLLIQLQLQKSSSKLCILSIIMTEQQQSDEQQHPTSAQQAMITPPLSPSIVGDAALPAAESRKEDHRSMFLIFLRLLMK